MIGLKCHIRCLLSAELQFAGRLTRNQMHDRTTCSTRGEALMLPLSLWCYAIDVFV